MYDKICCVLCVFGVGIGVGGMFYFGIDGGFLFFFYFYKLLCVVKNPVFLGFL